MQRNVIMYVEGNVDGTIGGSYFSLLYLASGIDRSRYEPVVVFATRHAMLDRFELHAIRTIIVPRVAALRLRGGIGRIVARWVNFWREWVLQPVRLAALLRRERVSILHLNNSVTRNHAWMLAALLARVPRMTHERGINPSLNRKSRWLAKRLNAVICISGAVRNSFLAQGLGGLRLTTIHNGLEPTLMAVTRSPADIRREFGLPADARLVGIVGNIKPWKGQEIVIRALAFLQDIPGLCCLVIGDTSPEDSRYGESLKSLVDELGLGRRVIMTGYRQHVADYINALEIQIHASVAPEPFGRVLLEAMAHRKPVVASDGGAVPEIVLHGETGLLFEPGNPRALAEQLRVLLLDPERGSDMGRRGHARLIAEFGIEKNVRRTEAAYDELLGDRRLATRNS